MEKAVIERATKAIEKMRKNLTKLNKAAESGLISLKNVNTFIEERDKILRATVAEEDVLDFMERTMLPYDEARKLLEDARASWPWCGEDE